MDIGVPKETNRHEHRVGLTPRAVSWLTEHGFTVLVERDAGKSAYFSDRHFEEAGAQIVYTPEEVYKRAAIVCKVSSILNEDLDLLKTGSVVCGFHHLAVFPREKIEQLMGLKATLIGYEIIHDEEGRIPVLVPFGELAGQMVIHIAANCLQTEVGGRGILMGNVPGVPPPTVLILGAGHVGLAAARIAHQSGAHVVVLDHNMQKLRDITRELSGHIVTALFSSGNLNSYIQVADVVVGAILIPGERTPKIITEEMVKNMRQGSVIVDVSIDQGGCSETSRPTTLDDPTYVVHHVVHYCVPNLTSNIARTASRALSDAALPYIRALASKGVEQALRDDPGLGEGVYMYNGQVVSERTGEVFGIATATLQECLEAGDRS